jgi:hypothetical protein
MNCYELRTQAVASVEENTAGAQDSQTRVDSVHGDHSADACFVHSAGRLSTENGALSTYSLSINGKTGGRSNPNDNQRPRCDRRNTLAPENRNPPQRSPVIDRMLNTRTVKAESGGEHGSEWT